MDAIVGTGSPFQRHISTDQGCDTVTGGVGAQATDTTTSAMIAATDLLDAPCRTLDVETTAHSPGSDVTAIATEGISLRSASCNRRLPS